MLEAPHAKTPPLTLRDLFWFVALVAMECGWYQLDVNGIDDHEAWVDTCQTRKVADVERQHVRYFVDVTDRRQAGVMHLLANDV